MVHINSFCAQIENLIAHLLCFVLIELQFQNIEIECTCVDHVATCIPYLQVERIEEATVSLDSIATDIWIKAGKYKFLYWHVWIGGEAGATAIQKLKVENKIRKMWKQQNKMTVNSVFFFEHKRRSCAHKTNWMANCGTVHLFHYCSYE